MRFKCRTRALTASALAASLAVAAVGAVAPSASAAPAETDRIAGIDRYETAADIATQAMPAAATVVLTTGEKLPDALSANPVAGELGAPILLTKKDSIPTFTQEALATIDPGTIVIVGGVAAVSAGVEAALQAQGYTVTREAGTDRFHTAAEVARAVGEAPLIDADGPGSQPALSTVALANGVTGLPDAVAASPMLHQEEIPLLLTGPDTLNEDAAAAIDALNAQQVLILGGTTAISLDIEQALEGDGIDGERLAGNDRWGTATAIADFEADYLGFDTRTADIASGFSLADALAGGPLASVTNSPIVLVSETSVPSPTAQWIVARAPAIERIVALGGTAVINDTVLAEAARLADEGATTNQDFTVTPAEAATQDIGTARTFTIADLGDVTDVDIALVDCAEVANTNGVVTFGDDEGAANEADDIGTANATADINGVNGVVQPEDTDFLNDVAVVNREVTFTLAGEQAGCVVAVVFDDADDDNRLDLDLDDQPTERFVVTGPSKFVAMAATNLVVTPQSDTNPVSTNHTVTATLTDQFGQPAGAQTVTFEVFRNVDADSPDQGDVVVSRTTQQTDEQGHAVVTYAGPAVSADDTIVACIESAAAGDANTECDVVDTAGDDATPDTPNGQAVKFWVAAPTAAVSTADDSCVRFADAVSDVVDVEDASTDQNLRFAYDGGDRFNIVDRTTGAVTAVEPATFEQNVTAGDRIDVDYQPGGISTYTLVNDTDCTLDATAGEESTAGTGGGAPTAVDADFSDATGGTDGTFGDEFGDSIRLNLDDVVTVDAADTVTIDVNGAAAGGETALTCGTQMACGLADGDTTVVLTVADAAATPDLVIMLGTSVVSETGGIVDSQGLEIIGLPEVIDAD